MEVECIGLTPQLDVRVKGRREEKRMTMCLVSLNCGSDFPPKAGQPSPHTFKEIPWRRCNNTIHIGKSFLSMNAIKMIAVPSSRDILHDSISYSSSLLRLRRTLQNRSRPKESHRIRLIQGQRVCRLGGSGQSVFIPLLGVRRAAVKPGRHI